MATKQKTHVPKEILEAAWKEPLKHGGKAATLNKLQAAHKGKKLWTAVVIPVYEVQGEPIDVTIPATSRAAAENQAFDVTRKLITNTVPSRYRITKLEEVK